LNNNVTVNNIIATSSIPSFPCKLILTPIGRIRAKKRGVTMSQPLHIRALHYRSQDVVDITIHEGKIIHIQESGTAPTDTGANTDEKLYFVGPGLVDLQVNGYQGFNFNDFPYEAQTIISATQALWKEGVTAYYPTVTTNSEERIEEAMRVIAQACAEDEGCALGIAGIHLEGPFISPEDGARGAHSLAYTRPPDWELFERWQAAAEGRIRIVTLSPEWPEAESFIARCTASGVKVSIGHTASTPEQIREATGAGATMSTHFGNGAHLMLPRHPNYLWEQLADDSLWTCLIADGFHIPLSLIKVVLRTKGEKAMLVSDAVYLSGMAPGTYSSRGRLLVKTEEGRIHLATQPSLLAGSAQMLPWGIGHLVKNDLCPLPQAWDMASLRPSTYMDLPSRHGLEVGAPADLVIFDWNGDQIRIIQTYKDGRLMTT
jgi:N-acetylglucosamine-6-phosphate deacetylase